MFLHQKNRLFNVEIYPIMFILWVNKRCQYIHFPLKNSRHFLLGLVAFDFSSKKFKIHAKFQPLLYKTTQRFQI
jgi:hypothetical protein